MILEVGHEFERKGKKYCVIDILELNSKRYVLFSEECSVQKMNFSFFEITETVNGYNLSKVTDDNINNMLFEKLERSEYEGE